MPGLSLWLVPYDTSPFTKTTQELISETVPKQFDLEKPHTFPPHVTITSDIPEEALQGKQPQEWLDSVELPSEFKKEHNEVLLELDTVEAEDPFFRKMNIALKENENLRKLVAACRKEAGLEADNFAKSEYRPHLSLLYAELPTKDVRNKVALIEMKIGFAFG